MRESYSLIKVLGECFEVNVGGVHFGIEFSAGSLAHVPGCHRDGPDAALVASVRHVHRVLRENDRIVVGEGDALARQRRGFRSNRLRTRLIRESVNLARLRDVPVLAETAAEVAPSRPEGEDAGAGKEVVERLFFDRIDAESGGTAVGGEHHPVPRALPDEAETPLPFLQLAVSRTKIALNSAVLQPMPPAASVLFGVHPFTRKRQRRRSPRPGREVQRYRPNCANQGARGEDDAWMPPASGR